MIAPTVVQEVRRLLAEGRLSQRRIAKLAGISRGTVAAIASGRRPDYPPRPRNDTEDQPAGPPQRCPGCGGMVYMPCRLCRVRQARAKSPRLPLPLWLVHLEEPLGLDLKADHRQRYEEVRAHRLAAEKATLVPTDEELPPEIEEEEPEFGQPSPCDAAEFGSPDFWDELQVTLT